MLPDIPMLISFPFYHSSTIIKYFEAKESVELYFLLNYLCQISKYCYGHASHMVIFNDFSSSPAYMADALHSELLTTPVTMNEDTLNEAP